MDLITIKREPIEVSPSQRLKRSCELTTNNLPEHSSRLKAIINKGADDGYPLHRLTWHSREDDEDGNAQAPIVIIELSRMETEEETAARVQRQEAYNQKQIEDERKRLQALHRRWALERITGHLTLEQLQALPTIEPEQAFGNHWLP